MQTTALIIAKSKSRRLPNKNNLPVNGMPMFLVNVKKCQAIFDRVYVSSDSTEMLKEAAKMGAIAIKRSKKLCGSVPNMVVYKHAIGFILEDRIIAVQANSPTVEPNLIRLVKTIMENDIEEVMTCHSNYKIYGSIWGLTRDRIIKYKNPRKPTPDVLIVDNSIDCHDEIDYNNIKKFYE